MEHPENVKIARPSKYPLINMLYTVFVSYFYHLLRVFGGPRSTQKGCDNCDDDSTHPIGRRTPFSSLRRFGPADRMCHTCVAASGKAKRWVKDPQTWWFNGSEWEFMAVPPYSKLVMRLARLDGVRVSLFVSLISPLSDVRHTKSYPITRTSSKSIGSSI